MSLQALMREMASQQDDNPEMTDLQKAGAASTLLEYYDRLVVKHEFHPGQLVQWKSGMKNKKSDGPLVVTKVLDEPVPSTYHDSGSCYFGEVLDLVLARIDREGDFVEYHYDSRRFEPYTGKLAHEV